MTDMAGKQKQLDPSTLKAFENAAAGHDGVLSDPSGELLIKPCTQAEIDFYQQALDEHPDFAEMMPTFMGTLQLGEPTHPRMPTGAREGEDFCQSEQDRPRIHGGKIATESAIVLENLEYGFKRANVLDLKLGSRLYDDGTEPEKAARLDKVASETTSGSLNFRIAGMKVWNGNSFDIYDKFYGRKFTADNVKDGLATFFSSLSIGLKPTTAQQLLEAILAEITRVKHMLEKYESRMYSASILIVYEGDSTELDVLIGGESKTLRADERAPEKLEAEQSIEDEEEEDEEGPPVVFKVKMIDFAHAKWAPSKGKDDNVITGLENIEAQMGQLIARFESAPL